MLSYEKFISILVHDGFAQHAENQGNLKREGRSLQFFSPLLYQLSYLALTTTGRLPTSSGANTIGCLCVNQ